MSCAPCDSFKSLMSHASPCPHRKHGTFPCNTSAPRCVMPSSAIQERSWVLAICTAVGSPGASPEMSVVMTVTPVQAFPVPQTVHALHECLGACVQASARGVRAQNERVRLGKLGGEAFPVVIHRTLVRVKTAQTGPARHQFERAQLDELGLQPGAREDMPDGPVRVTVGYRTAADSQDLHAHRVTAPSCCDALAVRGRTSATSTALFWVNQTDSRGIPCACNGLATTGRSGYSVSCETGSGEPGSF